MDSAAVCCHCRFAQVQAKVAHKHDSWVREFLVKFASLVASHMQPLSLSLREARKELDSVSLAASKSGGSVAFVTLVQRLRGKESEWQQQLGRLEASEGLLQAANAPLPDGWLWFSRVEGEWEHFQQLLARRVAELEKQLPVIRAQIESEDGALATKVDDATRDWERDKPLQGAMVPTRALEILAVFETRLAGLQQRWRDLNAAREALVLGVGSRDTVSPLLEELQALQRAWGALAGPFSDLEALRETPWAAVVPRKVKQALDGLLTALRSLPGEVHQYEMYEALRDRIQGYKRPRGLLSDLKSDALKERHWTQVFRVLKLRTSMARLTLGRVWDCDLAAHEAALQEIMRAAQGEMGLAQFLGEVAEAWETRSFDTTTYRNKCRLIRGWDDLFDQLDEHLSALASMKLSPYYRVFADQAGKWSTSLTNLRGLLDVWIDVQRRWVYLEGVFMTSADIRYQLPDQYHLFGAIDKEWVPLMRKVGAKPSVLEVAAIPNLQRSLERLGDLLSKVQKALGDYLERQRATFPRFYFVGDEDMLEILGNGSDPLATQRHLSKMFAGITSVVLGNEKGAAITGDASATHVAGMVSREGEVVPFETPVDLARFAKVNEWLTETESQMQTTLASLLSASVQRLPTGLFSVGGKGELGDDFLAWVAEYPAQTVLLAMGVLWGRAIDAVLRSGDGSDALEGPLASVRDVLNLLATQVLQRLEKQLRKKYEQLITELVYNRDVTRELKDSKVSTADSFQWLYVHFAWVGAHRGATPHYDARAGIAFATSSCRMRRSC